MLSIQVSRVTFDYAGRSLTFAPPSEAPAPGVAVPIHVNPGTGLASVEARVDGHAYRAVLDCGGGYSWWRGEVVRGWLEAHPDWFRAQGAVGASNQGMSGEAFEHQGTVVRVPHLLLGDLDVPQAGLLGSGPAQGGGLDSAKYVLFWRIWGSAAPEAPVGWIGANILKRYRLTLDYPHRVSYWQEVAPPETDELHGVGLSLSRGIKNVHVAGLVARPGAPTLTGVRIDDFLTAIDGRDARAMTHGELLQALHGKPGETHRLTLDRKGTRVEVEAPVGDY